MRKLIKFVFGILTLVLVVKFWPKKEAESRSEKVLNLALESHASCFDPIRVQTIYENRLLGKVYEGLFEYHYLKRPFEVVPNLAAAMPSVSPDGLIYTFSLKKEIYFHNNACFPNGKGREVTAADFVYSFKRIADPTLNAPMYEQLASIIKGFSDFQNYLTKHPGDYAFALAGIQAKDRYTLQITLLQKDPLLIHYLTLLTTSVVAKEAIEYYGADFMNHPVGTGPFTIDALSPQHNKFVFIRNKHFRDKYYPEEASPTLQHLLGAAGKKVPFVDKIIYHALYEEQPRWLQFKEKKIDYIEVLSDYLQQVFEGKKLKADLCKEGIVCLETVHPSIAYIGFNALKSPLNNIKLRQAISLAFDLETYNRIFMSNLATLPTSFIPSCFSGHNETFKSPYTAYDLEKAKQYLAEAGYPNGKGLPVFTLDTGDTSVRKQECEFFAKCMERIGITVKVQQHIFSELCNKLHTGTFMMARLGQSAEIADAACFFQILRYAPSSAIKIVDPLFNQWYNETIPMDDMPARIAMYEKLNERASEMVPALCCPLLPLYFLTHKHVKNYCIHPFHYGIEQYVDIESSYS